MTNKRIVIIFDPCFGALLRDVDLSSAIWIVQSKDNDPIISELWRAEAGNITSFTPQDFRSLMGSVDEHHPFWTALEVIGTFAQVAEHTLLDGEISETAQGFQFKRTAST